MTTFECPGSKLIKQPRPEDIKCSKCGADVEIWNDEFARLCPNCKNEVTKEIVPSCADWCPHVKECLGEDLYNKYMEAKSKEAEKATS